MSASPARGPRRAVRRSARPRTRQVVRVAAAAAALATGLALAARPAAAQCPAGAVCAFGTDQTGSSTAAAANVLAGAARAAFLTRLKAPATESFDGIADGTPADLVLGTFAGAGDVTLSGSGAVLSDLVGTDNGRYATSGAHYFEAIANANDANALVPTFSMTFGKPVAAFGFFASDLGDLGSQLTLRFGLANGGTLDWTLPYLATTGANTARDGSLLYAGFVSPVNFTSVTFLGTGADDDYFALDDVTVAVRPGLVTPEPSTLALSAAGLAAAAAAARRRRRA